MFIIRSNASFVEGGDCCLGFFKYRNILASYSCVKFASGNVVISCVVLCVNLPKSQKHKNGLETIIILAHTQYIQSVYRNFKGSDCKVSTFFLLAEGHCERAVFWTLTLFLWPVLVTFDSCTFLQISYHDNHLWACLPHHSPEIHKSRFEGP